MNTPFIKVKARTKRGLERKIKFQEDFGFVRKGRIRSEKSKIFRIFPWKTHSTQMMHVSLSSRFKLPTHKPTGPWPDNAA